MESSQKPNLVFRLCPYVIVLLLLSNVYGIHLVRVARADAASQAEVSRLLSHHMIRLTNDTEQLAKMADRVPEKHSYVPPDGYVADQETALKIAEAIWLPIYGSVIHDEKPFSAILAGEKWIVRGSFPGESGRRSTGGVAEIEIDRNTGQILRVSHGK